MSPILFTVYIDDLLIALEDCGIGCFWKHHFVRAVCYADDSSISLLAPPSALRYMLNTCLSFAIKHHLTFNPDKTQLIKFYKCADAISPHSLVSHSVLETLSIILVTYLHITLLIVKIFLLLLRICVVKPIVCYIFLPAVTPLLKLTSFLAFVSHCMVQLS